MNRSTCSRADLVRVLAEQAALVPTAATLLGYQQIVRTRPEPFLDFAGEEVVAAQSSIVAPAAHDIPAGDWPEAQAAISMWLPYRLEQREALPDEPPHQQGDLTWRARPTQSPRWHPIAAWPSLVPRLRVELTEVTHSSRVDIQQTVQRLAQGQFMEQVPRQTVRRWGDRLQVIVDRSERLIPFRQDQAWFLKNLNRLVPSTAIQLVIYDETRDELRLVNPGRATRTYQFPPAGVSIVVLSDLGALSRGHHTLTWLKWAAALLERGTHALAVVPCSPSRVPRPLRTALRIVPWQKLTLAQSCGDPATRQSLVDQLFRFLAPAKRIEPGLLRAMRRIITQAADASLEADFWQDPRLASPHVQGATPQADRLPDFRELTIEDRRRALAVIRQWRQPLPAEIWISEIWGLDAGSEATLPADDREDAQRWQATLAAHESGEFSDALIAWLARTTENTPRHAMQRHRILRVLHRRIHGTNELLGGDLRELPPGPVIDVAVAQMGGSLVCCLSSSRPADSHWHSLGLLRSRTASVIVSGAKSEDRNSFWKSGRPPGWARDWGRDKFGAWVTFQIESPSLLQSEDSDNLLDEDGNALPDESPQFVTQRLRWIPAGTFLMGSPESEAGRWPDERPQHEVTLTRGFWMFDTPVTQQLWRAVMGDNPSQFNGDLRPVEKVSWDDTQRFLKALNQKLGDAVFVLPSEAQWEHACRAGTNTAYAFGDDAAKLDDFAWYRDNSAGKTHPVATKQPNAWGLFDMHGNVLEWCQDFWTGN